MGQNTSNFGSNPSESPELSEILSSKEIEDWYSKSPTEEHVTHKFMNSTQEKLQYYSSELVFFPPKTLFVKGGYGVKMINTETQKVILESIPEIPTARQGTQNRNKRLYITDFWKWDERTLVVCYFDGIRFHSSSPPFEILRTITPKYLNIKTSGRGYGDIFRCYTKLNNGTSMIVQGGEYKMYSVNQTQKKERIVELRVNNFGDNPLQLPSKKNLNCLFYKDYSNDGTIISLFNCLTGKRVCHFLCDDRLYGTTALSCFMKGDREILLIFGKTEAIVFETNSHHRLGVVTFGKQDFNDTHLKPILLGERLFVGFGNNIFMHDFHSNTKYVFQMQGKKKDHLPISWNRAQAQKMVAIRMWRNEVGCKVIRFAYFKRLDGRVFYLDLEGKFEVENLSTVIFDKKIESIYLPQNFKGWASSIN